MQSILDTKINKRIPEENIINALNRSNVSSKEYKSPSKLQGLDAVRASDRLTSAVTGINKKLIKVGKKMIRRKYTTYFIINANPIVCTELNRITNASERARVLRNGLSLKR